LVVAHHQIEIGVRGIDDDGAGRFAGGIADDLALQARRHFGDDAVFIVLRGGDDRRRRALHRRRHDEGE
jgi:hypothetical protein